MVSNAWQNVPKTLREVLIYPIFTTLTTMDDESGFSTCDLPEGSSLPPDSQINAEKAIQYWNDVPSSLSGIMGGFPQVRHPSVGQNVSLLTIALD